MPRQLYPGQSKFSLEDEVTKLAKRRTNARLHMAKIRQHQLSKDITNQQRKHSTKKVTMWREKQKQHQINIDQANEQMMSQKAVERYHIN